MKQNITYLALLSIFFLSCNSTKQALTPKDSNYQKQFSRLLEKINPDKIKNDIFTLASDQMQGRNTGEPGQKQAAEYLANHYKSLGILPPDGAESYYQKVPAKYMKQAFSPIKNDSENVWAMIKGSEKPEEIIVISAHYDHLGTKGDQIYNGADDNASGTTALLEISRAFKRAISMGLKPKRSILFLHFTGEEHGLYGSRYYTENPLFPLKNTIVDINIDMIGRQDKKHKDDNNYIYVIGSDRLSTELHQINETVNNLFVNLNLDYKYNKRNDPERIYYRSDHYNFAKRGVPSIFYFNGVHKDYHQTTDTPEKINIELMTKRIKLAFALTWNLSVKEQRIIADRDGS